eukprot:TRINITY_DN65342_c0_g1_i1.p1 TRINITY_DN65342_c0_g1~~TRINITY_DN65342_c0_g1_i1.p1  ORF type:complete len:466 (-),score=37.51 TRINITY_DN65342_c0_g1_i1:270-1577(-)
MDSAREALLPAKDDETRLFDAVCIIAGSSIGGGILALPSVSAPMGFLPCVFGLVMIWLLLAFSACALAEACAQELAEGSAKAASDMIDGTRCISIFSVTRHAFGAPIGVVCSVAFFSQLTAMVTAQVAKCGQIIETIVGLPYAVGCIIASVSLGWLMCTTAQVRRAEFLNSALTMVMFCGFSSLVVSTVYDIGASSISVEAMSRRIEFNDWRMFSPFEAGDAWAVPVLLAMLVFSQSVPYVVQRLETRRPDSIGTALVVGSGIPVAICIAWAFISTVLSEQQVSDPNSDPVLQMLTKSAYISVPVLCFAGGAIGTTLIASYLALQQFGRDCIYALKGSCSKVDLTAFAVAEVGLTTGLACSGPGVYLPLLALSGAFPSTLLYVVTPPLATLALRTCRRHIAVGDHFRVSFGGAPLMMVMVLIGVAIVVCSLLRLV